MLFDNFFDIEMSDWVTLVGFTYDVCGHIKKRDTSHEQSNHLPSAIIQLDEKRERGIGTRKN